MKLTEDEKSKTPEPPKRDQWLSMKNDASMSNSKLDDDKEERYNKLIEKDKKIIREFQNKSDKALYDQNDYSTFMKDKTPLREQNDNLYTPTREKIGNYKYTVKDINDKENIDKGEDPYLSFVGKSASKYDFNRLPHQDEFQKPLDRSPAGTVDYKRTSYTPDALRTYGVVEENPTTFVPGNNANGTPDRGVDGFGGRYPSKNHIVTWQQNPVDSHLQTTPYKGMNYPDMINKIREDRLSEQKEYGEQEKMRKHLQRTALKNNELISNQRCDACIQNQEEQNDLTEPSNNRTKANKVRYQIPHSCVKKLDDSKQMADFAEKYKKVKTDQDFNWYRKVSKYEIDSN